MKTVVWLTERRHFAFLESRGAHFSTVSYVIGGIEYEENIENDEYITWEENSLDYE